MKYERRYPELKYLMEHFHQDWKCDHHSDVDLLRDLAAKDPALVEPLIVEIQQFIAEMTEPQRADAVLTKEWQAETPYESPSDAIRWLKGAVEVLSRNKQ